MTATRFDAWGGHMAKRNYSLLGPDGQRAVETGLAAAEWYHTEVPRKVMKELMQRKDGPAIRDTGLWLGSMVVLAGIAIALWVGGHPWWSVPFWLAYGVLYGSASDSRWHESSHGTAFKTPWMNNWVYQIACFMIVRNPHSWRWSHARHHTDTYIVGRDPEIAIMRPPELFRLFLNVFGIIDAWNGWSRMLLNAAGKIHPEEATYTPRDRVAQGHPRGPHLDRDLRRHDPRRPGLPLGRAASACRPAPALRRLAPHHDGAAAARRAGGQRHRPPAQLAHRVHEPDQPVHLLEHELPRGAPHVPHGALPRAAEAARNHQARPPEAQRLDRRGLRRDVARAEAPASARGLLPEARAARDREALSRGLPRRGAGRSGRGRVSTAGTRGPCPTEDSRPGPAPGRIIRSLQGKEIRDAAMG
ncbi:putative hydrocarbon oxygenase MocD [Rubellimicrobium mesophilum DSM 19309]|uniref:Putative hydrocarbon oxygenase MocD n=1 Tax=Rubellimicrobium mesophilum DSM 19309 TaxID=442562 RepID=A0A017HN26_9RHOB|nr:putative hydrocarbon oxygenase MocD [Rubellimicrobium mesophilum DSM 19309]